MTVRLLIAEDAPDIAEGIAFGARMTWPGCEVVLARDGTEALRRFEMEQPDLVVLDVNMPPPDGFEVCRRIRESSDVPILMLTVRDATLDKVHALDLGADDYLTKPFEPLELLARLRALLRRSRNVSEPSGPMVSVGDVMLDSDTHEVRVRGEIVQLTAAEYRLLEALMRHPGTVLTHHYLLSQIWGDAYVGNVQSLKVFVRRLRRKLDGDHKNRQYIQNERGMGYRFISSDGRIDAS